MKAVVTKGIVLARVDYGEADRIVTVLTPDHGKLRLMARGVRKLRSKLAGGIELFSVSELSIIEGRGEVGTLISARLQKHYGRIIEHIDRVQLGYELLKLLNKATEDQPEAAYFELLEQTLEALDEAAISTELIKLWFSAQLLKLAGHSPNLQTAVAGEPLKPATHYNFSFDAMAFAADEHGGFTTDHIKFLRLVFGGSRPPGLQRIATAGPLTTAAAPLVQTMLATHIRI